MRKTITKITCDDCGVELPENYKGLFFPNNDYDICYECIAARLRYSFIKYPVGYMKCSCCSGEGKYKVWNDPHSYIKLCGLCNGTGKRKLE